jgi:hypothetical protein
MFVCSSLVSVNELLFYLLVTESFHVHSAPVKLNLLFSEPHRYTIRGPHELMKEHIFQHNLGTAQSVLSTLRYEHYRTTGHSQTAISKHIRNFLLPSEFFLPTNAPFINHTKC